MLVLLAERADTRNYTGERLLSGSVLRRRSMRAKAPNVKSPSDFASVSRSSPDSSRGVGTPAPWPPSPTAAGRGRSSVSPNRYDWRC